MTALVKRDPQAVVTFSADQVDLIKRTVAQGATDDELKIFMHQCQRTGLDPLARQIYFQKRRAGGQDRVTIITGIDGYRLVADRTGQYAGNDDPVFDDEERPQRATVTVYKLVGGVRCPYTATARWSQYYPGDAQGFMWKKMPHLMLGKCAEALALRKAFPAELSGIYTPEEMEQAGPTVDAEAAPEPKGAKVSLPRPAAAKAPAARTPSVYNGSPDQENIVKSILVKRQVPEPFWDEIGQKLMGRPSTDIDAVIQEVRESVL